MMQIPKTLGKAEAMRLMRECVEMGHSDPEASHSFADQILCAFLRAQGNRDIVDAFEAVDKY